MIFFYNKSFKLEKETKNLLFKQNLSSSQHKNKDYAIELQIYF